MPKIVPYLLVENQWLDDVTEELPFNVLALDKLVDPSFN